MDEREGVPDEILVDDEHEEFYENEILRFQPAVGGVDALEVFLVEEVFVYGFILIGELDHEFRWRCCHFYLFYSDIKLIENI